MIHGGDIYSFEKETGIKPLDFSENTNPFMLTNGVKKAIMESIDSYNVYPDPECRALKEGVSDYYKIKPQHLVFGNGAADIIFKIAYGLKPKHALILAPTFSEYELALKKVQTQVDYFLLKEEEEFAITQEILDQIPGHDIVYICNPNNPTGKTCNREMLLEIGKKCKELGAYLIIDECFMDFVEDWRETSLLDYIEAFDNLLILKAFTKIFAMAGLRLGFGISSNAKLLQCIQDAGQPWSVSTVAQVAGVACCKEEQYVKESLEEIKKERLFLKTELQKLGFKVFESEANYLLLKSEVDLGVGLRERGIMVRSCGNYHNLTQEYYRIAVKQHVDNQKLIDGLRELFA